MGIIEPAFSAWGQPVVLIHYRSAVITQTALPTVTVRGFLNFRTTVDGTVIVFTPASAIPSESAKSTAILPTIQSTLSPQTIINTKSSVFHQISPTHVPQAIQPTKASQQYPTGLVTVLGGTVVRNGETTIHETKVIGTYIDGKYAQILQSTARVEVPVPQTPVIRPTQTSKYSGPSIFVESPLKKAYVMARDEPKREEPKAPEFDENNGIQSYRKPEPRRLHPRLALNPLRSRWTQSNLQKNDKNQSEDGSPKAHKVTKARLGTRRFSLPPRASPKVQMNRFKAKLPATALEERQSYNSRLQTRLDKQKSESSEPKADEEEIQSAAEAISEGVIEERQAQEVLPSEPIDPSKVATEVQTITSEVTKHVNGNQIQVETVTLTTTIQRPLDPAEFGTDLIAPTVPVEANDVDVTSVQETPPLVVSRTYSVTERSMRTTVIPVFDGTVTNSHTVTESFFIRKLITVYKTLPPGDMFLLETASISMNDSFTDLLAAEQSVPSLYEGAIEITEEPDNELVSATAVAQPVPVPTLDPSTNLGFMANNQLPQFDMNNPLFLAAALQNPQLAAVYLGLQQLKQQAPQYNTITKPTTYVTTDTVYNTKVVSFYDGRSTRSRTLVEPVGTTERTLTTYTTEVTPVMNGNLALQQAQFHNVFATNLVSQQFQMTPQYSTITKTVTTLTDSTSTKTKVYTLVYNAFSTRYRTVTSTSVIPTVLTTVITSTVPYQVANTAQPFNIFG
ncbi:unnamed protein product [Oppiella nova]|uniref:DUF4758 domain-containing protein n=1 Tax=Oppiella nova TaxID=334625 RepID=A0A7R9LBN2_9ACAR|nr:unnamed protein product [Oppiella nova]CAG2161895.1 unnamed protein product [Oppiella nova]